jgi:hypothetical protein
MSHDAAPDPGTPEATPKLAHWILGAISCFFFVLGYGVLVLSKTEPSTSGGPGDAALGGCLANFSALAMTPLGFIIGLIGVAKNRRSIISWVGILLSLILFGRVWAAMH